MHSYYRRASPLIEVPFTRPTNPPKLSSGYRPPYYRGSCIAGYEEGAGARAGVVVVTAALTAALVPPRPGYTAAALGMTVVPAPCPAPTMTRRR